MKFLPFFALAALASCSIQLDSQYGLRLEPSPRGPRSDAHGELNSEIRESAPTTEVSVAPSALEAATALTLEFAPSGFSTALETPKIAEVESEATASIAVEALNPADESIQRAETASSEWPTKKTAHTMKVIADTYLWTKNKISLSSNPKFKIDIQTWIIHFWLPIEKNWGNLRFFQNLKQQGFDAQENPMVTLLRGYDLSHAAIQKVLERLQEVLPSTEELFLSTRALCYWWEIPPGAKWFPQGTSFIAELKE